MSALHYAAFFDVGPIVTTLLMESKVKHINFFQKTTFFKFYISFQRIELRV